MATTLLHVETEVIPRTLVFDPPLTDVELESLCHRNEELRIERTSEGAIRVNPPAGLLTGHGNSEIIRQLGNWWDTHRRGRVFDSNTGFYLDDGSLLSPDAAYVLPEQLSGMTKADLSRMPHLCPAFVVELLSPTDSLVETRKKLACWIVNGAQLGWPVDPYRQCVEVFRPGIESSEERGPELPGLGPASGFVMDLPRVWRCYEV